VDQYFKPRVWNPLAKVPYEQTSKPSEIIAAPDELRALMGNL
jgi:hypothetical protein